MQSTGKDLKVRKGLSWNALHDMKKIWSSKLSMCLKIRLFQASIESILLYGCEAWTLTTAMTKSLDGCYNRMLWMVQNVSGREHMSNEELDGPIPKLSEKVKEQRLRLAGHCHRHTELSASKVMIWDETLDGL